VLLDQAYTSLSIQELKTSFFSLCYTTGDNTPGDNFFVSNQEQTLSFTINKITVKSRFSSVEKFEIKQTENISFGDDKLCVAYNSGSLFVSSSNALSKFTMERVEKMYEISFERNGWFLLCALSNNGSLIYIADGVNYRLITADSQRNLLATLDIERPVRPHVMPSGHVLVVCENRVEQISQDGKSTLGTLKQDDETTEIIDAIYHHKKPCLLVATREKGKAVIFEMTMDSSTTVNHDHL